MPTHPRIPRVPSLTSISPAPVAGIQTSSKSMTSWSRVLRRVLVDAIRRCGFSLWLNERLDGIQPRFTCSFFTKVLVTPGSCVLEFLYFLSQSGSLWPSMNFPQTGIKGAHLQHPIDETEHNSCEPETKWCFRYTLCCLRVQIDEFYRVCLCYNEHTQWWTKCVRTQTRTS